jgi:RNA polymerase sigma factor (sigma-70 family)
VDETRSDAELLRALRGGDRHAYAALWRRHSKPAHRYARRLIPGQSEDLVSASFLSIYQQVTGTEKGPEFAFRSYLYAVIRNTAIRWRRDADRLVFNNVDVDVVVDEVDLRDGISVMEQELEVAEVAAAFQGLPDRWRRVLWLTEIVQAGRPEIARQLGITPNAVSALQRRARMGLKFQWLGRQIPAALQEDTTHVARLIPRYLTEPGNADLSAEVSAHVAECAKCAELLGGMPGLAQRL